MKNSILLIICLFLFGSLHAQRYCAEIFDSVSTTTVDYGSNLNSSGSGTEVLNMTIYQPIGDTVTNRPMIIWVHGGSFISGSKDASDVVTLATRFAKRGYVTASINYRKGLDAFPPNKQIVLRSVVRAVQDAKASVRYMRKSAIADGNPYNIDQSRILMGGSSAGAITALTVGYLSNLSEFQIVEDSSLVVNLGGLEGNSGSAGYSSSIIGVVNLCGAIGHKSWIANNDIPLISMHGTVDATVPYKTDMIKFNGLPLGFTVDGSFVADSFAHTVNTPSVLYTWVGQDHVPYASSALYMDSTVNFVSDNLCNMFYSFTSIKNANVDMNLATIYPNPAQDNFVVKFSEMTTKYSVEIFDVTGKVVYTTSGNNAIEVKINRNDIGNGLYFVKVSNGSKYFTNKLVLN